MLILVLCDKSSPMPQRSARASNGVSFRFVREGDNPAVELRGLEVSQVIPSIEEWPTEWQNMIRLRFVPGSLITSSATPDGMACAADVVKAVSRGEFGVSSMLNEKGDTVQVFIAVPMRDSIRNLIPLCEIVPAKGKKFTEV
jgi:hypothetical protein